MEQLLHYVWKHKMFPLKPLTTTDGQPVEVIDSGLHNHDSGPDFFNAKIKIGSTLVTSKSTTRRATGSPMDTTRTSAMTTLSCTSADSSTLSQQRKRATVCHKCSWKYLPMSRNIMMHCWPLTAIHPAIQSFQTCHI